MSCSSSGASTRLATPCSAASAPAGRSTEGRLGVSTTSWSRPGACDRASASSSIGSEASVQELLAGLAIAAPLALGVAATSPPSEGHRVFAFDDPAITEASALVVDDGLFLTTNDSGHAGRVFAVDGSGHTVGVTLWSEDPTDTEALAPAGPG